MALLVLNQCVWLTVKPKIDRTNLKTVSIKVGQQVNLDVNVAGEPAPTITWTLKDTVRLYFMNES